MSTPSSPPLQPQPAVKARPRELIIIHDDDSCGEQPVKMEPMDAPPWAPGVSWGTAAARWERDQRGAYAGAGTSSLAGKQSGLQYVKKFVDDTEEEEEEEEVCSEDTDADDDDDYNDETESEEEEEEEMEEAGEGLHCTPSNGMNNRKVGAGEESPQVFSMKMFEGICIADVVNTKTVEVARRTRSHFSSWQRKKRAKRGTFRKPICIDGTESSSESEEEETPPPAPAGDWELPLSSSEEDETDSSSSSSITERWRRITARRRAKKSTTESSKVEASDSQSEEEGSDTGIPDGSNPRSVLDTRKDRLHPFSRVKRRSSNGRPNAWSSENGCNGLSSKRQSRRRTPPEWQPLHEVLMKTMLDEMENGGDDFSPAQNGDRLPLVFSFGDEDEEELKKEVDKFQEELWADFDFALEAMNIGAHHCNKQGQKSNGQDHFCAEGKHDLILDDQIGIKCKNCPFVQLEIRFVMPHLGKLYREKEALRNLNMDAMYDDLLASYKAEGASSSGGHCTGLVWDLIPGVREDMFPHQREAFEFLWRNLAGGVVIEELKRTANTDDVGGCVISHDPGTGKTRLAIAFVQSYVEFFPRCAPMIVAPSGMLATWQREFGKWNAKLPFQVLNSSELHWDEDRTIQELVVKNEKLTKKSMRIAKLISWHKGSSILGVSYTLFKKLVTDESEEGQTVRKLLLERSGLLVLDEGHTPRNNSSLIWKALTQVKTEKRIILSGTPFQNNFQELYNILCLVKPKFGNKNLWSSLTSHVTDDIVRRVKSVLEPFVHIYNGDILQSLPGLREYVVILNPLPHQKEIITRMQNIASIGAFDADYKISLASVHPSTLLACTKLSIKEAALVNEPFLREIRPNPREGVKTWFVVRMVRFCAAVNERVLVFSQYHEPLSLIKDHLVSEFSWTEGKELLQMTGNTLDRYRQPLIEAFNDAKSEARVMLASTKAFSEGIRLTGASRVVFLDVVWNPAVGKQALARAYRIGQEKVVHTYNLIAARTKEEEKYQTQTKKDHVSKLLFSQDPQHGRGNIFEGEQDQSSKLSCDDKILEEMAGHVELRDMFVNVLHSH